MLARLKREERMNSHKGGSSLKGVFNKYSRSYDGNVLILKMETVNAKINEIVKVWPLVSRFVSVPHTKEQYENAVKMLDELIDKIGEDETHPLASLMETLGTLIKTYENQHLPETASDPVGVLD